jgi:CPA1 family monovalent cation:H+ antiporter
MHLLDIISLFIFLGGLFIFINIYYLKQPSAIGLMILALILSIIIMVIGYISPSMLAAMEGIMAEHDYTDLLYQVFINFMLFAAALQLDLGKYKEERTTILIIAITGVLLSTLVVGTSMYYFLAYINIELSFWYCMVFGALISATDPIATATLIKKFNLSPSLERRIRGESLINDGIAVVVALILLDVERASEDHSLAVLDFAYIMGTEIFGGIIFGLFLGFLGFKLLEFVDNEHVEIEVLVTLALVLVGTQAADFFHFSSKLTAIIMGVIISNESRKNVEEQSTNDYVFKFWFLIEETLNAMLFVFIGLEILIITPRFDYFAAGFIAYAILLFARWVSIAIPIGILSSTRRFERNTIPLMTWGSLRSGMPIAVSLCLPESPHKSLIITMTFVIVVFSILYQGLTITKLMHRNDDETNKYSHSVNKL